MSWSKLHGGAHRHRKVLRLAAELKISILEARGLALTIWSWTIETEPDGNLTEYRADELARAWDWPGDANALIAAIVSVGLLDREDEGCHVHDWMDYAEGWKDAERKRADRKAKKKRKRPENVQDAARTVPDAAGIVLGMSGKRPVRGEERKGDSTPLPPADAGGVVGSDQDPSTAGSAKGTLGDAIREVIAHYRTHHPQAFKNPSAESKEWKLIRARLKEGCSVERLCAAIDGCHMTPHNLGHNEQKRKYLDLSLIVRDESHVTRFAETAETHRSKQARASPASSAPKTKPIATAPPPGLFNINREKEGPPPCTPITST